MTASAASRPDQASDQCAAIVLVGKLKASTTHHGASTEAMSVAIVAGSSERRRIGIERCSWAVSEFVVRTMITVFGGADAVDQALHRVGTYFREYGLQGFTLISRVAASATDDPLRKVIMPCVESGRITTRRTTAPVTSLSPRELRGARRHGHEPSSQSSPREARSQMRILGGMSTSGAAYEWELTVPGDAAELAAEFRRHDVRPGQKVHIAVVPETEKGEGNDELPAFVGSFDGPADLAESSSQILRAEFPHS